MADHDTVDLTEAMDVMDLNVYEDSFSDAYHHSGQYFDSEESHLDNAMDRVANAMFPDGWPRAEQMSAYVVARSTYSGDGDDESTIRGDWTSAYTVQADDDAGDVDSSLGTISHIPPTDHAMYSGGSGSETGTLLGSTTGIKVSRIAYQPPPNVKPGVWVPVDEYYWLRTKLNPDGQLDLAWFNDNQEEYAITGEDLADTVNTTLRMYDCARAMNRTLENNLHTGGMPSEDDPDARTAVLSWRASYKGLKSCDDKYRRLRRTGNSSRSEASTRALLIPLVEHLYETHQQVIADQEGAFDVLWKQYGLRCSCDPHDDN